MRGLPASIIKKYGVSKKAWSVFRGRHRRGGSRRVVRKIGGGFRRMARRWRYRGRRRRGGMTIPIAPVAGLLAGLAPAIDCATRGAISGTGGAIDWLVSSYTGIRMSEGNRFDVNWLMRGIAPLTVGLLVHKFVGGAPLNLNRTLARARVPFIRI